MFFFILIPNETPFHIEERIFTMKKIKSIPLFFSLHIFFLCFSYGTIKAESSQERIINPVLNTHLTYLNYFKGIKEFSLGSEYTLLLTQDGEVYAWGLDERSYFRRSDSQNKFSPGYVQALEDKNIRKLSSQDYGKNHIIILDKSSKIFA